MINTTIPKKWDIPNTLLRRFGKNGAGKQRAMFAEDHLLIVLHALSKTVERERQAIIFWLDPKGNWLNSANGEGIHHLRLHIENYSDIEVNLNKQYDQATSPEHYFELLEKLTPLVRTSQNLCYTMQQARDYSENLEIIDLWDRCQEIAREFEILYTDCRHGLEYQIAKRGEEQARYSLKTSQSSDRLNILVAIFLPITAISGIFGMNLKNGLENLPTPFSWAIMISAFMLGIAVKSWVLSPAKTNTKN